MSSVIRIGTLLLCLSCFSACQQLPVSEPVEETPAAADVVEPTSPVPPVECQCPVAEVATTPLPPPVASKPCPSPPKPVTAKRGSSGHGLQIIGRVENVFLKLDNARNKSLKVKSRIDTGAGISSMHGHHMVEFERDGKPWVRFAILEAKTDNPVFFERKVVRFVEIKQLDGQPQRRPVVRMSLTLGNIEENLEITLTDRTGYVYQVLVGRNFLRDRAVVDVSRKFIADDDLMMP